MNLIYIATDNKNFLDLQKVTFAGILEILHFEKFAIVSAHNSPYIDNILADFAKTYHNVVHTDIYNISDCYNKSSFDDYLKILEKDTGGKLKRVYVAGMPMNSTYKNISFDVYESYQNINEAKKGFELEHKDDRYASSVLRPGAFLYYLLASYKTVRNIEFMHFVLDPNEMLLSEYANKSQYYYDKNQDYDDRFTYLPIQFYRYAQEYNTLISKGLKKKNCFVLGLSVFKNKKRKLVLDSVNYLVDKLSSQYANQDEHIAVHASEYDDEGNRTLDTLLPRRDYLKVLENSESTLILPSYNSGTFSVLRFVEAIIRGCVPIVDANALYEVLPQEVISILSVYDLFYNSVADESEVLEIQMNALTIDSAIKRASANRTEIIDELMRTKFMQELMDYSTYEKMLENF